MMHIDQANSHITIQDLGRTGVAHLGVPIGGAIDRQALTLANRLVANPDNCAALEFSAGEFTIRFEIDTWVALCGGHFDASISNRPLWNGWRGKVNKGESLYIRGPKQGMYGYLAIMGGIDCETVLKGKGTDITNEFGGHHGRYLEAGDRLNIGVTALGNFSRPIGAVQRANDGILRALPGPELALFSQFSKKAFWHTSWKVSNQSNRMGTRLDGQPLSTETDISLRSHGVMPGVVQVPPNGQPIVLMADAQTTGGYPRIACVIAADLWKVAQTRPRQALIFQHISPSQAQSANYEWQQYHYRLARAMDGS
ncbi:biotin-dependent carboxyltransferase family protein [Shewanella mesophila]|uniref:5-oxoprolinase subunit C family protein n=1 Tax=Shewanella mesophila TaxID=2864208 RepID=UPI001C657B71|nr:biotin-dependent carboxyltransferase family protein [Shewanella mesophila]QYJ86212.1 biotin-dependent carboxyltransferase family protein [Shewanella mesophila]